MATTHYTAKVRSDGSLVIPREARLALNLKPGDHIDIGVESESALLEVEDLRRALDIGIDQIDREEYSTYTKETLHGARNLRAIFRKKRDETYTVDQG